jgi:hypothetical protein
VALPLCRRDDTCSYLGSALEPVHAAFAKLGEVAGAALHKDLAELVSRHARATGASLAIPSEYLEVIAIRRD